MALMKYDTIKFLFELKTMMIVSKISVATTTIFNVRCGCIDYGVFGDLTPKNLLTIFDKLIWFIDIANL
ncbi:hypothetical protein HN51_045790, partial [Arachis hypogaea]